jgi:hypothetical protein
MAGRGPAPKPPEQRTNHHAPQRGEWTELEPLKRAALPALPARSRGDGWSPRTRRAWAAWRKDPVTATYGPSEIQLALDLAYAYEEWVRGRWTLLTEIRQLTDRLGLNPKGKRDLRLRVAAPKQAEVARLPRRERKLRAV